MPSKPRSLSMQRSPPITSTRRQRPAPPCGSAWESIAGKLYPGVVGSRELMEFTVIGRTVNIASRVEGLTRAHNADILVTGAVADALDDRFVVEPLGPQQLRGVAGTSRGVLGANQQELKQTRPPPV